jgi:hypothetical protein
MCPAPRRLLEFDSAVGGGASVGTELLAVREVHPTRMGERRPTVGGYEDVRLSRAFGQAREYAALATVEHHEHVWVPLCGDLDQEVGRRLLASRAGESRFVPQLGALALRSRRHNRDSSVTLTVMGRGPLAN